MIEYIDISINGKKFIDEPLKVLPKGFVIAWQFGPSQFSQSGFDIKIGSDSFGLGTDLFVGNVYEHVGSNKARQDYSFFPGVNLPRSLELYGQIRIFDQFGNTSFWKTFTVYVNDIPHIIDAYFLNNYGIESGITLNVIKPNADTLIKTRWFQNGKMQSYLDDSYSVPSRNIEYGDVWNAQVIPYNELESGLLFDVDSILIPNPNVYVSNISIIPSNPNPDDILEVSYSLYKNNVLENIGDESVVRWYVNDVEVSGSSDSKFARLNIRPNDIVHARIDSNWSGFSGNSVLTDRVTIGDYNLQLENCVINGVSDSNFVSYDAVNVLWNVSDNIKEKVHKYHIKLGHSEGSSNLLSTHVDSNVYSFFIPPDVLEKGMDYYVSVAPVDKNNNIGRYETVYFKTFGNTWNDNISASNGYTIFIKLKCEILTGEESPLDVLSLNIADGAQSYVVDFHKSFVRINIDTNTKVKADVDNSIFREYILSVKGNDINLYVDGILLAKYNQSTQISKDKYFNLIPRGGNGDLKCTISSIRLSVDNAYHLDSGEVSALTSFSEIIDLPNLVINDIEVTPNGVLVAAKDISDEYSKIYKYDYSKNNLKFDVESLSESVFVVNHVDISPAHESFAVSSNKGISLFKGDPFLSWDSSVEFQSLSDLYDNNWSVVSSSGGSGISIVSDGLYISNSFASVGRVSTIKRSNELEYPSFVIKSLFLNEFSFSVNNGILSILNNGDTNLRQHSVNLDNFTTIDNLVTYLKDLFATVDNTSYIKDFFSFYILNGTNNLSTLDLVEYSSDSQQVEYIFYINNTADSIDPYADASQTSFSGGRAFISHNSPGSPWFDSANSASGYSLEIECKVNPLEDSLRPVGFSDKNFLGIYINDGSYDQEISFSNSSIRIAKIGKNIPIDLSEMTKLRFNGIDGRVKLWKKSSADRDYVLLDSFALNPISNISRNITNHKIFNVNSKTYVMWIEDDGDYDSIRYIESLESGQFSAVYTVPVYMSSIKSFDFVVTASGYIYVSYETFAYDHSDIIVISKNDIGWSTQFNISNDRGSSIRPSMILDENDGVHVLWSDSRTGVYEIMHAYFDSFARNWVGVGDDARAISSSGYAAYNPAVSGRMNYLYATWTELDPNGNSHIKIAKYNIALHSWTNESGLEIGKLVSNPGISKADLSDIIADKDGNVHIVYQDIIENAYKIFYRQCSAELNFYDLPSSIVSINEISHSVEPSISLVDSSGDLILCWKKSNDYIAKDLATSSFDFTDPYSPNLLTQTETGKLADNGYYFARWSRVYRSWLSSGSSIVNDSGSTEGGYDSRLDIGRLGGSSSVALPKLISSNNFISTLLYDDFSDENTRAYIYELDVSLPSNILGFDNQDPYSFSLNPVSDALVRKSLLIGDASNYVSTGMTIKSVSYSVSGARNPLSYRKVGYLTHIMPSDPIIKSFVADDGDVWMIGKSGIYYYDYASDQVFNSWESSLWDNNNLASIIGNASYVIKDAFIDPFGNMFVFMHIDNSCKLLISADHFRWFEVSINDFTFDVNKNIKINFNGTGNMVVGKIGQTCLIKDYILEIRNQIPNSSFADSSGNENSQLPKLQLEFTSSTSSPSLSNIFDINDITIDNSNNISVSTNLGLFFGQIGNLTYYGIEDGLPGSIVKSVYAKDAYSRICTFERKVAYMNGASFDEIPLISNYPISTFNGVSSSNQTSQRFDSGKLINTEEYGKYLLISSQNGLIVILNSDPVLMRKLPKSVFFGSELLDIISSENARSIVNKELKFSLPSYVLNDPNINKFVVQVFINGNAINRGYEFSAKQQVINFLTSLLPNDKVTFNLRTDIVLENNFSQNGAEKAAFGVETRNVKSILFDNGQSYAVVHGNSDYIAVSDENISLPYDEVILDRTPPSGKVKFISQTGPDSIYLGIDPPSQNTPYDAVSGIASMVISNYDNFTSDGSTPIDPIPFRPTVGHNLISALSNNASIFESDTDNFSKLITFTRPNSVQKLYAFTSSPIRIYERETSGSFSDIPLAILENGNDDFAIGFVHKFGSSLIIGTRSISGINSGKVIKTTDMQTFTEIAVLPGSGATSAFMSTFDQNLYIGTDGSLSSDPNGSIVVYNGESVSSFKNRLDKAILSLSGFERFLFAGTYDSGYIYRIDIASGVVEIIHADSSDAILSLTTLGTAVFGGTAGRGVIIRAKDNDVGFIDSFKTVPSNINVLKTIQLSDNTSRIYAGVGSKLYSFKNAWTLEGTADSDINDFVIDENDRLIFCSNSQVKSVQPEGSQERRVFVKLIDNAGNETDIKSAPDTIAPPDGYNDDLTLVLTSEELAATYLQSKMLEVDGSGNVVYYINGDAPFYSSERIMKETGVYLSEVFNGTTGHVSWGKFAWEGFSPDGTDIRFYIRVSDSRSGILSQPFTFEIDKNSNNVDISFLNGQYLQIKVVMRSLVNTSPYVSKIVITNNAGSASHFFTNTFPLPANIKRGIITLEKDLPVGSDIIVGVSGRDATDFSQYQIIPENRIFSFDNSNQGQKLRVGFRFVSPQNVSDVPAGSDLGSLQGLGSILSNSIYFDFENTTGNSRLVDFKIDIFEDQNMQVLNSSFDSLSSPQLFRVNGNPFPGGGGVNIPSGFGYRFHFIPFGAELACDSNYFVKVSVIEGANVSQYGNLIPFRKVCGVNFVNDINFTYINQQDTVQNLHFEVAFYEDELRQNIVKSYSSLYPATNFKYLADFFDYPLGGLILEPNQSSVISLSFINQEISKFDSTKTYYVTISYFDLNQSATSRSVESMNYTFRVVYVNSDIACGSSSGVPVLKGFAFMFELEDGRLIKFNYLS
jgi:hypothetical protein